MVHAGLSDLVRMTLSKRKNKIKVSLMLMADPGMGISVSCLECL